MVFIDTWAWLALALRRDQHHLAAIRQYSVFVAANRRYVTTDYVLSELITQLYRALPADQSKAFVNAIFAAVESGAYRLERITAERFDAARQLREQYADKPAISFVDFTSFCVMHDLRITDAFTGDRHFIQVNLGIRIWP